MSTALVSSQAEATDLQVPGAKAPAEHGIGASYFYDGNRSALTPEVIANKFSTLFTYADNYRKRFLPEMLEAYAQYNGEPSGQAKEPWQSDLHVPLAAQAVDVASGRIIKSMFESEDSFEVDPDRSADTIITEFAKHSVKWQIRKGDGLESIKVSIKDALICGIGPLKVHYSQELVPFTEAYVKPGRVAIPGGPIIPDNGGTALKVSERMVRKIRFEPLIPTDVWLDPSGKSRWLIQRTTRYPSDLWPLCSDLKDENGEVVRKAVYDKFQTSRVKAGMRSGELTVNAALIRRDDGTPYGSTGYDNTCDVFEFWGDFPDPDTGVTLFRNVVLTVVDKRICIRYPQTNPLYHCSPPYVIFTSKLLPHQVYGYGILRQPAKIQNAINRQANVVSDKNLLQVPTVEYDPSASKDPAIQNGSRPKFSPGKMWPRKPGPDKRIFYPVEGFQPVQPMDLAWLDRLTNWHQIASTVPEFASGAQMSNNRKTAQEAQIRTAAANENFNDAATHIEGRCMGPLLKLVYLTMVQYEDQYDDPDLERMFGADDNASLQLLQQLKTMSPAERWATLYLDAEFKSVGITNEITRQAQLQEFSDFMRLTSADPLMSMFIDKRQQLGKAMQLFHQPQRMVLEQGPAMLQAMQAAQLAQLMGPQPGAMGPPMGPGGAPGGGGFGGKNPPGNPHNSLASVAGEAGRT